MNNLWNALQAETHASLPDHKVNFVRRGEGRPVLMIHGLAASLHDWDDLLPAVAAAGFAAYACDLLGHGESAKPKTASAYTAENAFQHWRRWWEQEAPPRNQILIGHSLGGYMALEYALRFPERLSGLVLINPFYSLAQLSRPLQRFLRYPIKNTDWLERTPYWVFRLLVDLTSLRWEKGNIDHILPEHIRAQSAWDYKRAAPGIYNLPRTIRNLEPELKHIRVPTLLLWGERDQTLDPLSFKHLLDLIPTAKGVSFPRCAHIVHQCHPQQVNEKVLDFLAERKMI
ncbi:MAG: alpha/beta hydrolase [Anaerolineales bacterium]